MGIGAKGRDLSGIWECFGYSIDGVGFEFILVGFGFFES